jgi:uncharacterized protein (TIGR02145 family)
MIFRKIVVTAAIACLVLAFTACGDDDSSSFVEPEKESSDSGATLSGDSHEGSSPSSCSSKDDKSSSSVSSSSTNSSSSAKSSSSTDVKSSSSITSSSSGTSAGSSAGNSSSSKAEDLSCTPEEEGQTFEFTLTGKKYICKNGSLIEIASSSSAAPTSSYFDMTNQFNEKVSYGEFTDPRDGQTYRTADIYDKVYDRTYTIFAENLNYGKMVMGGSVQGDSTKYCYDDDPWYCENGWGGLYTWSNAMGFPAVCDSVSVESTECPDTLKSARQQGICPEGWHIMNDNEWANIAEITSRSVAHYMGSKVAGFGTNDYGLSILPAGYWQLGKFDLIKVSAGFYLPQQYDNEKSIARAVYVETSAFNRSGGASKIHALSIRCVKNY